MFGIKEYNYKIGNVYYITIGRRICGPPYFSKKEIRIVVKELIKGNKWP